MREVQEIPISKKWHLKVNSVTEACTKCFAVHILHFEILQITWKNETKNIRPLVFSFSSINLAFWCFFFHVVCKISNFNMWTAKYLAQASCTELTLSIQRSLTNKAWLWIAAIPCGQKQSSFDLSYLSSLFLHPKST